MIRIIISKALCYYLKIHRWNYSFINVTVVHHQHSNLSDGRMSVRVRECEHCKKKQRIRPLMISLSSGSPKWVDSDWVNGEKIKATPL